MTDLTQKDLITSKRTDGLAEYIAGTVERWTDRRDVEYRKKWEEYWRMWRGEWAPQDRDRASERSRAIMPAIAQAVDSAVAEIEEAMFGRERWFDVDSDNPNTGQDEGQVGRFIADNLLADMRDFKPAVSQAALLAAVYGTGIAKVVRRESEAGFFSQELIAVDPFEFAIDPAAETVEEASGVAHCFHLPRAVILERQRQGIYYKVDPGSANEVKSAVHGETWNTTDTDTVYIIEYHGLVPSKMLPERTTGDKLAFEDDRPVEAIVTVANNNVLLRADVNPLPSQSRAFFAFQYSTVPGRFWGRGCVEMGYWPQKVLDAEIRSRIDALAFSVHPMMAINAAMVPRNADFSVRPGRNIFLNGNPGEAMAPLQFPPPDPQTYTQSQEMARYVEMATGQLQAATPFDTNGRNETASGMSMILGASIRRTRRTLANIERQFLKPMIRNVLEFFQLVDEQRYPAVPVDFKVMGALGTMAKEFEQMQLTQLMNSLPPGPPQLLVLRAIVDNMSMLNREPMVQVIDQLFQASLQPQEPPPDLAGMARMLSAKLREQEVAFEHQIATEKLLLERSKLETDAAEKARLHEREVMRLSIDADRSETEETTKITQGILNLAKAEAEELGSQLSAYKEQLAAIDNASAPGQGVDLSGVQAALNDVLAKMTELSERPTEATAEDIAPIRIDRDPTTGLIQNIAGRTVQRDANGLIETIQ